MLLGCSNKSLQSQEIPELPNSYADIPELFLEECRKPVNELGLGLEDKLKELAENHSRYAECYIKHRRLVDAVRSRQD
jgi:hypothetical protein